MGFCMSTTNISSTDPISHILASITKKRGGEVLTSVEIEKIIRDFVDGKTLDYQMSAWLATIACVGMTIDEIEALTRAYLMGKKPLKFMGNGLKVMDKHSTGGVGDKVSLVVVPIVAACGVPVVKISGRGLGYAGGTLDKLESIPGLKLDISASDTQFIIDKVGMVITGQSAELVPGDKATYSLRDVTSTVESIPLIAASILSKKIAFGADGLVLDVKTGEGALIKDIKASTCLAETMVNLASRFNINCRAVITDMSQPLGYAVGNALEVKEALDVLQGNFIPGLTEICLLIAKLMLQVAEPQLKEDEACKKIISVIENGSAYNKFLQWAHAQGADIHQLMSQDFLPKANRRQIIKANISGWIQGINPRGIGTASLYMGAGRLKRDSKIDHSAGIILHKRVGDSVKVGDSLAEVHYSHGDIETIKHIILSSFIIGEEHIPSQPIIHQILGN